MNGMINTCWHDTRWWCCNNKWNILFGHGTWHHSLYWLLNCQLNTIWILLKFTPCLECAGHSFWRTFHYFTCIKFQYPQLDLNKAVEWFTSSTTKELSQDISHCSKVSYSSVSVGLGPNCQSGIFTWWEARYSHLFCNWLVLTQQPVQQIAITILECFFMAITLWHY